MQTASLVLVLQSHVETVKTSKHDMDADFLFPQGIPVAFVMVRSSVLSSKTAKELRDRCEHINKHMVNTYLLWLHDTQGSCSNAEEKAVSEMVESIHSSITLDGGALKLWPLTILTDEECVEVMLDLHAAIHDKERHQRQSRYFAEKAEQSTSAATAERLMVRLCQECVGVQGDEARLLMDGLGSIRHIAGAHVETLKSCIPPVCDETTDCVLRFFAGGDGGGKK